MYGYDDKPKNEKVKVKRGDKFVKVTPSELTDKELNKVVRRFSHTEYDRNVGLCASSANIWAKYGKLRVYIPIDCNNSVFLEKKNDEWVLNWNNINPEIEPNPIYFKADVQKRVDNFKRVIPFGVLDEIAKRKWEKNE